MYPPPLLLLLLPPPLMTLTRCCCWSVLAGGLDAPNAVWSDLQHVHDVNRRPHYHSSDLTTLRRRSVSRCGMPSLTGYQCHYWLTLRRLPVFQLPARTIRPINTTSRQVSFLVKLDALCIYNDDFCALQWWEFFRQPAIRTDCNRSICHHSFRTSPRYGILHYKSWNFVLQTMNSAL